MKRLLQAIALGAMLALAAGAARAVDATPTPTPAATAAPSATPAASATPAPAATAAPAAITPPATTQPLDVPALAIFGAFVVLTLGITYWAAMRTRSAKDFYAAGGGITGLQNGLAIAGDRSMRGLPGGFAQF